MRKTINDTINSLKNSSREERDGYSQEAYAVLLDTLTNTPQFMDNESEELAPPDEYYIYIDNRAVRPIFYIGILLGMVPLGPTDDVNTALADRHLAFRNIGTQIYSSSPYSKNDDDEYRKIVIEPTTDVTIQIKWHHICLAKDYIRHLLQAGKTDLIALIALSNNPPELVLLHTFLQYHLCSEFGIYLGDKDTDKIVQPQSLIISSEEKDEEGKGGTRSKPRYKKNRTKKNKQKRKMNKQKNNKQKKNKQKKSK